MQTRRMLKAHRKSIHQGHSSLLILPINRYARPEDRHEKWVLIDRRALDLLGRSKHDVDGREAARSELMRLPQMRRDIAGKFGDNKKIDVALCFARPLGVGTEKQDPLRRECPDIAVDNPPESNWESGIWHVS